MQVTLVPWVTSFPDEFGSPWTIAGVAAAVLRAVGDGNHASCAIIGGMNDSNSIRGTQWRVEGTGAVFSWVNKIITNVALQFNFSRGAPAEGTFLAVVSANEPLTYAEQIFNGEIVTDPGPPTWMGLVNSNHAQIKAALLADNFLLSVINYNHSNIGHTVVAEAARIIVDYTDNTPTTVGFMAMEV